MLNARWYKIRNDLWHNKTRTILIVLSIAVGLFAVGTIISSRAILSTEMEKGYAAINPSSGTVRTSEPFGEAFIRSVRNMPDVADADARRVLVARVQINESEWVNLTVFAVADYDTMRVNKIWPERGAWPPPEREILIERAALPVIQAEVGDVLSLELPNKQTRELRIAGTAHDLAQVPAQFDNSPYGYISFETLEWFGEPYGFNELHVVARDPKDGEVDPEVFAKQVVATVKNKAEKSGLTIPLSFTAQPGQLPLDDILQAVLLLLGTLGMLSLFLSMFLIINTVSALLAQQKRQIGVMKALGARSSQIMGMYLTMVIIYGVLALILAVPLSIVGARALTHFMATLFNFDIQKVQILPDVIVLQVAVGVLLPVLASLYPFLANLRVTPAEAISVYSLGKGRFGIGVLDRLLSGARLWFARRVLFRPLILSLRNVFRSKGRLALTLITLTLASAIFVSVFTVRASLFRSIDDLLMMWNFDMWISFDRPYRVERIAQEATRVPQVAQTDIWMQLPTRRVRPDGSESDMIYMFAPRAESDLAVSPSIVEGRWLLPGDEAAVVVSTNMLQSEPDIQIGDEIVLKIQGREQTWRVVGVSMGFMIPMIYANYPYIARITGHLGEADAVLVATTEQEQTKIKHVTTVLETHFERNGLRVGNVQSAVDERAEASAAFGIVISLMFIMAVLLAGVGGLGLMGTMSINVLERTREIGVLRAVGAPNRGVTWVFIREGVMIGLLSWLFGSFLALPLSKLICEAVGVALAGTSLSYTFSMQGVWVWFILVVLLSALASFLPARNASRLTVREVLAYE